MFSSFVAVLLDDLVVFMFNCILMRLVFSHYLRKQHKSVLSLKEHLFASFFHGRVLESYQCKLCPKSKKIDLVRIVFGNVMNSELDYIQ